MKEMRDIASKEVLFALESEKRVRDRYLAL